MLQQPSFSFVVASGHPVQGAGETLSGLVLPDPWLRLLRCCADHEESPSEDMAVVNYAGSDVCSAGPSDACDRAITATTAAARPVHLRAGKRRTCAKRRTVARGLAMTWPF